MDASQLAMKLLEWEQKRRELDVLEAEIQAAVLELQTTQTVGNVRASYRKGSRRYDYEMAVREAQVSDDALQAFQSIQTDWRAACKAFEITNLPVKSQSGPSVSIKLLE